MTEWAGFWPLVAISAAAALAYGLYFRERPESFIGALVKAAFMAALAIAFKDTPFFVPLAFALAAAGDFFLAFTKAWALPLGMISFFAMQFLYIVIFIPLWLLSPDPAPVWPRYVLSALTVLVVAAYLVWFWGEARPKRNALTAFGAVLGALTLGGALAVTLGVSSLSTLDEAADPVMNWPLLIALFLGAALLIWLRRDLGLIRLVAMIYAALIVQMALMSYQLPWAAWPAMLGAILFLVSDGVLSAEFFRMAPDAPARQLTGRVVWWTYVGAQALIVTGMTLAAGEMQ